MMQAVTTIDLLRHGAPEGGNRYRGSLDDPLSEQGWTQMRTAVGQHCPWQFVISSPLRRCADFARKLAERHQLPWQPEPAFQEMSFGAWEGRTAADILLTTPEALDNFWRDPLHHPPPGGESLVDCNARVLTAWHAMLERYQGQHVLLVSHGGVIRILLRHVLDMPLARIWRLEVPYASISRVRVHGVDADAQPLLVFHAAASAFNP